MPTCPECLQQNPELGAKCPRCEDSYYVDDEAAESSERDPYIGKMAADKFVVVSRISEGGMGTVYQALQLPVDRKVAFKVLRADLEDNEDIRRRFIREARAVAKIAHPNIIHLHDFGFDESGYPYMVMEYAPGTNLDEWIYRDDITLDRALHVTRQILSALADAHAAGIVHRDLKPENIIVRGTGTDEDFIKLLDFGIARMVNEQATSGLTREGEVFGTPHYMSPEQAEGETGVGTAADVYAIGLILYEMLCGEHPFDAPKPLSILFKQINEPLPRIEPRPGFDVPDWVGEVIRKATEKKPAHRFEDAGAMLAAFEDPRTITGGAASRERPAPAAGDPAPRPEEPQTDSATPTPLDSDTPAGQPTPSAADVDVDDPDPTIDPTSDDGTAMAASGLGWGRRHLVATVIGAGVVLLLGGSSLFLMLPTSAEDRGAPGSTDTGVNPTVAVSDDAGLAEGNEPNGAASLEASSKTRTDAGDSSLGTEPDDRAASDDSRVPAETPEAADAGLEGRTADDERPVADESKDESAGSRSGPSDSTGGTGTEREGIGPAPQTDEQTEEAAAAPDPSESESAEDSTEPKPFGAPAGSPSEQTESRDKESKESNDEIEKFGDPSSVDDSSGQSEESNDTDDSVQKFGPPGK